MSVPMRSHICVSFGIQASMQKNKHINHLVITVKNALVIIAIVMTTKQQSFQGYNFPQICLTFREFSLPDYSILSFCSLENSERMAVSSWIFWIKHMMICFWRFQQKLWQGSLYYQPPKQWIIIMGNLLSDGMPVPSLLVDKPLPGTKIPNCKSEICAGVAAA